MIFVMEAKHQQRLQAQFARLLLHTPLHCLDIPDDYACMDPALMALLEARVGACLAEGVGPGA